MTMKRTRNKLARRTAAVKSPGPVDEQVAAGVAELALTPSVHGAAVVHEYMKAPSGELDLGALVDSLEADTHDLWAGDMKRAEAMLYGQAHALQAIFTNLVLRANSQEHLRQMEMYLRLALKAQSQCRATLETLATIKAGPAIFTRQANIAHGPQQVNNGVSGRARAYTRAGKTESVKNELLPKVPTLTENYSESLDHDGKLGQEEAVWPRRSRA